MITPALQLIFYPLNQQLDGVRQQPGEVVQMKMCPGREPILSENEKMLSERPQAGGIGLDDDPSIPDSDLDIRLFLPFRNQPALGIVLRNVNNLFHRPSK